MFDHVSIGVKDLERARRFYDAALAPLGYERLSNSDRVIGYGPDEVGLWVIQAEHPVVADMQSGLHFCFVAPDEAAVDAFHSAAVASGGTDNGEPGIRPDYGRFYYAAFVIDPDGHALEAVLNSAES